MEQPHNRRSVNALRFHRLSRDDATLKRVSSCTVASAVRIASAAKYGWGLTQRNTAARATPLFNTPPNRDRPTKLRFKEKCEQFIRTQSRDGAEKCRTFFPLRPGVSA